MLAEWIGRLGAIWIDGQVAQYKPRPGASTQFITVRDTDVDMSLTVVVTQSVIDAMTSPLEPGQRIVAHVKPEFWTGRGSLQLRARDIRPVGLGDLLAAIERLKQLLASEGLFAPERKKPLPFLPSRIGLICGRNSAAMTDVLVNARRRWPSIEFDVREVAVQGVQAVPDIVNALTDLGSRSDIDVIVIARGGGSTEDLLPFSNETLVRAVADCRIPVVSAIGHEEDTPLIDFVADVRASTPTDAAKRIVPSFDEQRALVTDLRTRSFRALESRLSQASANVSDTRVRLLSLMSQRAERDTHILARLVGQLRTLSPQSTLDRGYAIVQGANGAIVRDEADVAENSEVHITVASGTFDARRIAKDTT